MNPAAKGRNERADRWSLGAKESSPTIAPRPVMGRPGRQSSTSDRVVRREPSTTRKWLSIRKARPALSTTCKFALDAVMGPAPSEP